MTKRGDGHWRLGRAEWSTREPDRGARIWGDKGNQLAVDDEDQAFKELYGRKVGERLRLIRRQKRLSLQDVEATSDQEFKASVLGAYERGERAISVPRLQRLARFYRVPVDQLLPFDEDGDAPGDGADDGARRGVDTDAPTKLDLARLEHLGGTEAETLSRYVRMIQVQRQDFNGRVLTIRRDDMRAIAAILGVGEEHADRRLDDLGLKLGSAPAEPVDASTDAPADASEPGGLS